MLASIVVKHVCRRCIHGVSISALMCLLATCGMRINTLKLHTQLLIQSKGPVVHGVLAVARRLVRYMLLNADCLLERQWR